MTLFVQFLRWVPVLILSAVIGLPAAATARGGASGSLLIDVVPYTAAVEREGPDVAYDPPPFAEFRRTLAYGGAERTHYLYAPGDAGVGPRRYRRRRRGASGGSGPCRKALWRGTAGRVGLQAR